MVKNVFMNRFAASLLMLAMIAGGIWIGGMRSLPKMYNEVQKAFTDGVDHDGFSIANDIEEIKVQSYNLMTIAGKFLGDSVPEIEAVSAARNALIAADTPHNIFVANRTLYESVVTLYTVLRNSDDFIGSQANMAKIAYNDIESRNSTINNDTYNSFAKKFNKTISAFPASLISKMCGVEYAELFE